MLLLFFLFFLRFSDVLESGRVNQQKSLPFRKASYVQMVRVYYETAVLNNLSSRPLRTRSKLTTTTEIMDSERMIGNRATR